MIDWSSDIGGLELEDDPLELGGRSIGARK